MRQRPRRSTAAGGILAALAAAALVVASPAAALRAGQGRAAAPAPRPIADRLAAVERALFAGSADVQAAIKELKAVLAIDPQSRDAHVLLGIAYRSLGGQEFIAEAVAEFRQALAIDPAFTPARLYLAYGYRDLGRLERARDELQTALAQAPGTPQVLALLGDTERQLRNPARAIELEQLALAADGGFLQARYYLGLALIDLGRRDDGVRELELVVGSGAPVADAYSALGAAYLEMQRVREAIDVLMRGTRLDGSRPDLRIQLARALRTSGALAASRQQLALAAAGRTGSLLNAQQVDFDLALEQGLLALALKQPPAAVRAFQKALRMEPAHGPANRGLAEAYLLQGAYALAVEPAERAERAGSPLPEAQRALLRRKGGGLPPGGA